MQILRSVSDMKASSRVARDEGSVLGFVPTMGYLHEGHLNLVRMAGELVEQVVVSVFVNPTQFGPLEDLDRYPRDFERDRALLEEAGADVVFAPEVSDMYPEGFATAVHIERMGEKLCGAYRPGHFDGVCTVVAKLFEIVRPQLAVFGQKDGQQAAIIERMVEDLNMDVEIVRGPTVREDDGLAMSSRNSYLTDEERQQAPVLNAALLYARELYEAGETDADRVLAEIRSMIESKPAAEVQYISAVDWKTLEERRRLGAGTMIALAVYFGKTRLIDNIVLP
ncbi:MAG: pantoate--beta-alanine ligase [Candidatus Eisenbacteria bacterium]|nr:pantoate--beta-alanine ligase [Candidatus Eisenbacteria bacterium]